MLKTHNVDITSDDFEDEISDEFAIPPDDIDEEDIATLKFAKDVGVLLIPSPDWRLI
jgi:hypothetical protein